MLTGVDITDYGADLPGGMTLGKLVRHILRHVPELQRLRLSSIDQVEADAHLIAAIAEEPRLMPHLHLSLQSGDDMILKRMKRRHSRADAVRFCDEARRLRPDIVFGADLIAGFPTETEAMFDGSLRLVDDCGLTFLHVFPVLAAARARRRRACRRSPRAAVKERAARLRQKGEAALARHLEGQVGSEVELLVERERLGRTPEFAEMELAQPAAPGRAGAGPRHCVRRQAVAGRAARPQVWRRERHLRQIARPVGPLSPLRSRRPTAPRPAEPAADACGRERRRPAMRRPSRRQSRRRSRAGFSASRPA